MFLRKSKGSRLLGKIAWGRGFTIFTIPLPPPPPPVCIYAGEVLMVVNDETEIL